MHTARPLPAARSPSPRSCSRQLPGPRLQARPTKGLYSHVMDMSSLKLGPENYKGIPETPVPANAVLVTDFTVRR